MAIAEPLCDILMPESPAVPIFATVFSSGVNEFLSRTQSGSGVAPAVDNTIAELGTNSMKMACGATAGGTSVAQRGFNGMPKSKLGFEIGLRSDFVAAGWEFDLDIQIYDGLGNDWSCLYRLDFAASFVTVSYRNSAGVITALSPTIHGAPAQGVQFTPCKIVVDATTPGALVYDHFEYGAVRLNDVAALPPQKIVPATAFPETVNITLTARSTVATATTFWVGHALYSRNEN